MVNENISCFLVEQDAQGKTVGSIQQTTWDHFPAGDLTVKSIYSSLNFKDALAATGHRGVVKKFPHIPGIDLVGTIEESSSERFPVGRQILMGGSGFGSEKWGGWSQRIRLKSDEVFTLPPGLTPLQAATLGTAGFTAAQCVEALQSHELAPGKGPIVVSGATGGVGSLAIMILSKLGYEVVGITGKQDRHAWLRDLGAANVITREQILQDQQKPLLTATYSGAIDTVGGDILSAILKQTQPRGCVTACGMAASNELHTTVFPFILRGVSLIGIDSAGCPRATRQRIWHKLAVDWLPPCLNEIAKVVPLRDINTYVDQMLHGRTYGRIVVDTQAVD